MLFQPLHHAGMVIFVMALNTLHDLITKFCLLAYWGLGIRVRSKARQNAGTYEMVQYIWHREQYLLALLLPRPPLVVLSVDTSAW